jgi:GNAT superfamily N-acetyltransferase
MMPSVERIGIEDIPELISFLNRVFTGREDSRHFENNMPRMCRSEKRLLEHYVLREDGKICAAVGVFPYQATFGNRVLRCATVGNVAVAPEKRGLGYMRLLMTEAMKILADSETDISRLGGLRSRYEKYGYEPCGITHLYTLTERNLTDIRNCLPVSGYVFREMKADEGDALALAEKLYQNNCIRIHRSETGDFYDSLIMWGGKPYAALNGDGTPAGYVCTDAAGKTVYEYGHENGDERFGMLCAFAVWKEAELTYAVYPWDTALGSAFSRFGEAYRNPGEAYRIGVPSNFKVLNWEKTLTALLELKNRLIPLIPGQAEIYVTGYGNLRIVVGKDGIGCEKTEGRSSGPVPEFDALEMCRLCFGPYPPVFAGIEPDRHGCADLLQAWFPLPLSWNPCDNL